MLGRSTHSAARLGCIFALAGLLLPVSFLTGADFTWDGGHPGQNSDLDQKFNWAGNEAPPEDGTANMIFSGSQKLQPNAKGEWNVNSIRFNNWAEAFTLIGDPFTIQANNVTHAISNNSAFLQTINNDLILARNQSWRANTANLRLNGAVNTDSFQLTVTGDEQTEITGVVSGTGSLLKSGSGKVILSGANTYSGGTTVSSGQLQGTTTSLQGSIANDASLIFDQSTDGTYGDTISGTGTVIRRGSGVVTFSGNSTYTGETAIEGGTLRVNGGSAIGDSSRVVLSNTAGAIFDLAGGSETIGSLSGGGASGGNVTLGSGTLTTGGDGTSTTYDGVISGTDGSLISVGAGTLTLTGANTYSGGTMVSAGGLRGTTTSLQGSIANNASLIFDQSSDGTYSGSLSGSGTVTRRGSGVVTFSGGNIHTGDTIIESGTLRVSGGSAIGDSSRVILSNASGAMFDLDGSSETIGSLSGGGSAGGDVTLGAGTLTVGSDHTDSTYGGIISGTGALVKTGGGTLTVTGAHTYSGGTTVSGGELQGTTTSLQQAITNNAIVSFDQSFAGTYAGSITGSGDLIKRGSGTVTLAGNVNLSGGTGVGINRGSILLGSDNVISSSTNLFVGDGASLNMDGKSVRINELSFDNGIVDFGAGDNFFLFNDAGTHDGVLTMQNWQEAWADNLNGGIAFESGAGNVGSDLLNSIYFSGLGSGVLGDTNQSISGYSDSWNFIVANTEPFFTWDGGGNNNNWSTDANWEGGVAPPSDDATTRVAFDGDQRTTPSLNEDFTINALRFNESADAFTLDAAGNRELTMDGPVPSIIQMSPNDQVINLGIIMGGTTVIDTLGGGTLTVNGVVSGAGGISKVGEHTLIVTGDNTYSGHTTVAEGVLNIRHGNALGAVTAGTSVEGGARLELQDGIAVGDEALNLEGTLRNVSGSNIYGGAIAGDGLIDVQSGTLTLTGSSDNTFIGDISIAEGMLQLNKSGVALAVSGAVSVGTGTGTSTLSLLRPNQIAEGSAITLHAAGSPVFNFNDNNERIGALISDNAAAQVNLGSATLTVGDGSDRTYAGVISGSGELVKEGGGNWTLTGDSDYTGHTTVADGALRIRHSNALGAAGGGATVSGDARLEMSDGIAVGDEPLSLSGTLRNVSDSNQWGGAISGNGTIDVASGSLTLSGGSANTFSGSTQIGAGATLELNKSGGVQALGGAITIGDGSGTSTVRLQAADQIANAAALTLSEGGTPLFDLNNHNERIGSLSSANADASVTLGSGTLTVGDGNSTAFDGVISGTGGFTKTGSGALTLNNQNSFTGTTTVNQGTLSLGVTDALSSSSNLHLAGDSALSLGGTSSLRVNQFSFGDSTLEFGATDADLSFLFETDGAANGTFRIRDWTFDGSNAIGVKVDSVDQDFLNNMFFTGIGVGIGANIAETATTVSGYGDFFLITPIESFVWSGGTSPQGGGQSSTVNWSEDSNWEGGVGPGTGMVRQAIIMAGSSKTENNMDNAYRTNSLVFRDSAFTINSSTLDTITIGGGGVLNEAEDRDQTINVAVTLSDSQIWNAQEGNITASNTVDLQNYHLTLDGENDFTFSGTIDESGTGTPGRVTQTGSGTTTLSGSEANTYTGPTVIENGVFRLEKDANVTAVAGNVTVNTGGTLLLASTEQIVDTANITLGGGTIQIGGNITETMNNLTLTADSVIDFGGGDGILEFNDFIFSDGTDDYTLTVRNWTGNIGVNGGGGPDQLVFGTELTENQLAQIRFEGYDPSIQLDDLEVVPIPEPGAVAAGVGLLGLLGWRERRRLRALLGDRVPFLSRQE